MTKIKHVDILLSVNFGITVNKYPNRFSSNFWQVYITFGHVIQQLIYLFQEDCFFYFWYFCREKCYKYSQLQVIFFISVAFSNGMYVYPRMYFLKETLSGCDSIDLLLMILSVNLRILLSL